MLYIPNKYIYYGDLKRGLMEGKGLINYANELTYFGNVRESRPNGKGKLFNANFKQIQAGNWKDGVFENGNIYVDDRNVRDVSFNSQQNRPFKIEYYDGVVYEGEGKISDGEFFREGQGKISNGRYEYVGEWRHNRREGVGKEYFSKKIIFEGSFKSDVR